MRVKSFSGGVHPREFKYLTSKKPIEKIPTPKIVIIPLSQHTGAPAKPIVKPKDKVKIGTKIGEPQGHISAGVHSTISGTVRSIEPWTHPAGPTVLSVIIESDGADEWKRLIKPDYESRSSTMGVDESLTPFQIIDIVKRAGIVGLGGAAFPTHVKLSPPKNKSIDTIILNGSECEPYLTADHRLMLEKPYEILEGGKLIARALCAGGTSTSGGNAKKKYIAIEENKPDVIKKFKKLAPEFRFELCIMRTKYPQGSEKQLIKVITNKEVPSGGLPFDVGVCVQNVGTSFAIYEACKLGKPLIERVVTVTGNVKEPKNLLVRIGTLFKDLIEFCSGYDGEPGKIIMGGPMMGIAQSSDEVPVVKATSGILVQKVNKLSLPEDIPCIRCGSCVKACPMGLLPSKIKDYVKASKFEEAKVIGILDCIECGSCAWACPSKINLIHYFKYGKLMLQKTS
ncbi:electron transport complex subunit RsxC [candidate division WOR-3 bacterium]|nr:electron transport complex subunit RsxC [candidate division WOR-3 bacterium]